MVKIAKTNAYMVKMAKKHSGFMVELAKNYV